MQRAQVVFRIRFNYRPSRLAFLTDRGRDDVGNAGVIHHRAVHVVFVAVDVHAAFGGQRYNLFTGEFPIIVTILDCKTGDDTTPEHFNGW